METRQTQAENGRVSEEQSHLYLHRFRNRCRKTNRNSTGTDRNRRHKIRTASQHESSRSVAITVTTLQRHTIGTYQDLITRGKLKIELFFFFKQPSLMIKISLKMEPSVKTGKFLNNPKIFSAISNR